MFILSPVLKIAEPRAQPYVFIVSLHRKIRFDEFAGAEYDVVQPDPCKCCDEYDMCIR
jgi:hypothetical protein